MSALLRMEETGSSTWASTTSILHISMEISQRKGKLGKNTMCSKGTKGCRLKYKKNRGNNGLLFSYSSISPPSMYPRGSIYSSPNRKWRVESEHSQGIWNAKSQVIRESMRKNPKTFGFMHNFLCTWVLAQTLCIHTIIALKVVYTHKHVFLGTFLGHQSII